MPSTLLMGFAFLSIALLVSRGHRLRTRRHAAQRLSEAEGAYSLCRRQRGIFLRHRGNVQHGVAPRERAPRARHLHLGHGQGRLENTARPLDRRAPSALRTRQPNQGLDGPDPRLVCQPRGCRRLCPKKRRPGIALRRSTSGHGRPARWRCPRRAHVAMQEFYDRLSPNDVDTLTVRTERLGIILTRTL